jgi:hypothetical protein
MQTAATRGKNLREKRSEAQNVTVITAHLQKIVMQSQILSTMGGGKRIAKQQRNARPPSKGSSGNKLYADWKAAQIAILGNQRARNNNSSAPNGPARTQISIFPGVRSTASITAPLPPILRLLILPPQRRTAA